MIFGNNLRMVQKLNKQRERGVNVKFILKNLVICSVYLLLEQMLYRMHTMNAFTEIRVPLPGV